MQPVGLSLAVAASLMKKVYESVSVVISFGKSGLTMKRTGMSLAFAGLQGLLGEAEAFGLVEEAGELVRRDRRRGVADHRQGRRVAGAVRWFRTACPAPRSCSLYPARRSTAAWNSPCRRNRPARCAAHRPCAAPAFGAALAALLELDAEHLLAGDVVQRHQRERESRTTARRPARPSLRCSVRAGRRACSCVLLPAFSA